MRIINSIHERNYKNSNYNEKYMQNIQREVSFTSIFIDKIILTSLKGCEIHLNVLK